MKLLPGSFGSFSSKPHLEASLIQSKDLYWQNTGNEVHMHMRFFPEIIRSFDSKFACCEVAINNEASFPNLQHAKQQI